MKLVIDTNVLVSGLLTPFGKAAEILKLAADGEFGICYDSRILTEYHQVLHRPKFGFDKGNIAIILTELESSGELVVGLPLEESLPDPDDNMFLEVAFAGRADCIITGNSGHYPQESCLGIPVFLPSEFVKYYKERSR